MIYVASIRYPHTTYGQAFKCLKDAEMWLDSQNNNLELTTTIETYDDNWQKKDMFYYTEGIT